MVRVQKVRQPLETQRKNPAFFLCSQLEGSRFMLSETLKLFQAFIEELAGPEIGMQSSRGQTCRM
jgi:hypothetical protein